MQNQNFVPSLRKCRRLVLHYNQTNKDFVRNDAASITLILIAYLHYPKVCFCFILQSIYI